jgi:hypothetical protein
VAKAVITVTEIKKKVIKEVVLLVHILIQLESIPKIRQSETRASESTDIL